MIKSVEEELDQLEKALEQDEEVVKTGWELAHQKYLEEDDPEMLENMLHTFSIGHKYKAWDGLMTKKGEWIDYHEGHTSLWAFFMISGAYTTPHFLSGLFLTGWIAALLMIFKHSWSNCKNNGQGLKGSMAEFGDELPYYAGISFGSAYFLEHHTGFELAANSIGSLQLLADLLLALA